MATETPARATRPRNRRVLIINAATELFVANGYPHVSMSDIAQAVSIGPSALYRHFRSKEDLLHETVRQPFLTFRAMLGGPEPADIENLLELLADGVLDSRGLGILWQRESRHLDPLRRDGLRSELVDVARALAQRLAEDRPELTPAQCDLLAWAMLGALMSVSFQRVQLPRDEFHALLVDIGLDIARTRLPSTAEAEDDDPGLADDPDAPTADRLVAAAMRLFAERGYQGVGIDEVAAEIGIAGPSVYHHFDGKLDLLAAAMGDGARRLLQEQEEITSAQAPPGAVLGRLVQSYVGFSFTNRHLLDLMITETGNLAPAARAAAIEQQRTYVGTWVRLLQAAHPELPPGHARIRVQAVLTMTNDIARTAHLRSRPDTRAYVVAIGRALIT